MRNKKDEPTPGPPIWLEEQRRRDAIAEKLRKMSDEEYAALSDEERMEIEFIPQPSRYLQLACELLGADLQSAHLIPPTLFEDSPPRNIGDLKDEDDERLAVACGLRSGDWKTLSEERRIPRMEAALASRQKDAGQPRTRTGRPSKGDTDKSELVLAALVAHHKYENDRSVGNYAPAIAADLAKKSNGAFSGAAVTRFMKKKFGEQGHKGYVAACHSKRILHQLAAWRGETPSRNGQLAGGERLRYSSDYGPEEE